MRVRPSAVYRNIGCMLGICLLFCLFYHIIDYDDRFHVDQHHRQKHLYLTVSKDRIAHRFGKLAPKRILMWTRVFGEEKLDDFRDCKGLSVTGSLYYDFEQVLGFTVNFFNWTATYLLSSDVVFKYGPYYLPSKNAEEKGFKLIVCKDYITEKYWSRTSVPSIPIVMRRKIYETSTMPPHSFIAMDDYISPREMAKHLISLESDKNAYAEYFVWRKGGWTVAPWNAPGYRNGFCRLCERLWEENQENKVVRFISVTSSHQH
uniref:Fucosyltransferase n=1 Tax=Angiostrongylus cantonensis TaxID=6313 RepID=A0A0K0DCB0_ANGCA